MKNVLALVILAAFGTAHHASAAEMRKVASSGSLTCAGSEPFWSADLKLNLEKGEARFDFSPAEGKKKDFGRMPIARTNNDGNVSFFRNKAKDFSASMIDSAARGTPCLSEGEGPENEHPYEIMFQIGGTPFVGCCK
jgi:uncharacterized membrane protein